MYRLFQDIALNEAIINKFKDKIIIKESGCWEFDKPLNNNGYSNFRHPIMGNHSGHRAAYLLFKGIIPKTYVIDHLCRNRACCNPDHLEAVTTKENLQRGNGKASLRVKSEAKTHCLHGHPYSENVTYINSGGYIIKRCLACQRDRNKRRKKKNDISS